MEIEMVTTKEKLHNVPGKTIKASRLNDKKPTKKNSFYN
jgi:hypothetical protein